MAIERIQIGDLVLEKTIIEPEEPGEEKEDEKPEVKAVSGHFVKEPDEIKGLSSRMAKGAPAPARSRSAHG